MQNLILITNINFQLIIEIQLIIKIPDYVFRIPGFPAYHIVDTIDKQLTRTSHLLFKFFMKFGTQSYLDNINNILKFQIEPSKVSCSICECCHFTSLHKSVYSSYQTLPYVEETFVFLGSRPPVSIKFQYGMWKTNVEINR